MTTPSLLPLVLDTTEAMISKGQLVDPVKFQEIMGWKTRQAVWKAAADNRVFFMEHQSGRYLPAFYADPAYQRAHLEPSPGCWGTCQVAPSCSSL